MKRKFVGNYILKRDPSLKKTKGSTAATTQHDLGEDSGDETKITTMVLKNMKGK